MVGDGVGHPGVLHPHHGGAVRGNGGGGISALSVLGRAEALRAGDLHRPSRNAGLVVGVGRLVRVSPVGVFQIMLHLVGDLLAVQQIRVEVHVVVRHRIGDPIDTLIVFIYIVPLDHLALGHLQLRRGDGGAASGEVVPSHNPSLGVIEGGSVEVSPGIAHLDHRGTVAVDGDGVVIGWGRIIHFHQQAIHVSAHFRVGGAISSFGLYPYIGASLILDIVLHREGGILVRRQDSGEGHAVAGHNVRHAGPAAEGVARRHGEIRGLDLGAIFDVINIAADHVPFPVLQRKGHGIGLEVIVVLQHSVLIGHPAASLIIGLGRIAVELGRVVCAGDVVSHQGRTGC